MPFVRSAVTGAPDAAGWRHTRNGDKYVTVIIGLTPVRDGTGPARLPDRIEGRSTQVFKSWLGGRPKVWTEGVEVVAMDGFTGFQAAAAKELPRSRLWIRFMSSGLPAMPWTAAVSAFDGRPSGTTDGPETGSTPPGGTQGKQLMQALVARSVPALPPR